MKNLLIFSYRNLLCKSYAHIHTHIYTYKHNTYTYIHTQYTYTHITYTYTHNIYTHSHIKHTSTTHTYSHSALECTPNTHTYSTHTLALRLQARMQHLNTQIHTPRSTYTGINISINSIETQEGLKFEEKWYWMSKYTIQVLKTS